MSNYKVGDEVLVKATITDVEPQDYYPYVVMTPTGQKTWVRDDDIAEASVEQLPWDEDEYNRGLQDAWELAKILYLGEYQKYSDNQYEKIFGGLGLCYVIDNYTPQEAFAKIEVYEKEHAEIKVGDVLLDEYKQRCVVSSDKGCDDYVITFTDGSGSVRSADYIKRHFKKTGKHIDIAGILAEIGKE